MNYARAPYLREAAAILEDVYAARPRTIADLDVAALERCSAELGLTATFTRASATPVDGAKSDRLIALLRARGATTYITGRGALEYLEEPKFAAAGIEVRVMEYLRRPYPQLHGAFDPHVSMLDTIANLGPAASAALESPAVPWHEAVRVEAHDMIANVSDVDTARADLERDGFVVLRDWLEAALDVEPLQRELGALIAHVARACGARHEVPEDPADFDRGYLDLVARHPDVQPLVYDMAKNLVAFQRLIVSERLADLYCALRGAALAGTAPGSNGVRIDRPSDERHLAPWHQEFQYQFRGLDAVTFWIPLVPVTREMGPVVLAKGSHRGGVEPLVDVSGNGEADAALGTYGALRIADEATIAQRYELVAPTSRPGDVFAFDFLTLHASTPNGGTRARWTAQIRYFNFGDTYGTSIRWMGGLKHGTTLAQANALLADARNAALRR